MDAYWSYDEISSYPHVVVMSWQSWLFTKELPFDSARTALADTVEVKKEVAGNRAAALVSFELLAL